MSSPPSPKILLFGTGAIGTIYAYLLLKAGREVTAVCRSNYEAAKENGFHIDSTVYGDDIHIHPKVVRNCSEAVTQGPFDYVLVTCKVFPEAKAAEQIKPAVTEGKTTIVLIQNGIGIEEEYAEQFPSNVILSCVVYLPVTQTSPGHILMSGPDRLEIGCFPTANPHPPAKANAERLVSQITSAGGTASFHSNIQENRWSKLLLNAPWNPICALTLSRDTPFLASSPFAENVIRGVLSEVVSISKALGYTSINEGSAEASISRIKSRMGTKGVEPSMLADVLWNRRLEVEVIIGNPVRIAKDLGVEVPRMEMLYALTKALDEANQFRKPGQSLNGEDLKATTVGR